MNLLSAAERLASIDRSSVTLDAARCLHTLDCYSACTACLDICPAGAIQPGKPPTLMTDQCQSCLACIPACPTGAFQADDAVSALLTCITRAEAKTIELVCEKHQNAVMGTVDSIAIRIKGCLAGLGSGVYMMLAALGIEMTVIRMDACANCEWAELRQLVELQVSQARLLLGVGGKSAGVICLAEIKDAMERPLWVANNPPLSRRDLFRMAAQQGKITMARAMENSGVYAEKQAGKNHRRLLSAIEHFSIMRNANPMRLQDFGFASITISDLCTACPACTNACPTQALRLEKAEDDTSYNLMFSPRDCIGCEVCAHVCAPAAITLNHAPNFDQVFGSTEPQTIHSGRLVRCSRCNILMAERDGCDLCDLCEYRRENPFGSRLPPGVTIPQRLKNRESLS